jgi:predicted transcriptional regulator
MAKPSMITFGISLRPEQAAAIDQLASAREVSKAVIVRWAVDEYLRRHCLINKTIDAATSQDAKEAA